MKKGQFTSIVKIKKQLLDRVEVNLAQERNEKRVIEFKITNVIENIYAQVEPKKGTISLITLFREKLSILRKEKESLELKLLEKNNIILQLQDEYKKANVEYEKMKYLEEQEYEKYIKELKKAESKELDEISTMLFANKYLK